MCLESPETAADESIVRELTLSLPVFLEVSCMGIVAQYCLCIENERCRRDGKIRGNVGGIA